MRLSDCRCHGVRDALRSTRLEVGSWAVSTAASRGRCRSHRRESQKRSAAGAQSAPAAGAARRSRAGARVRRRRRRRWRGPSSRRPRLEVDAPVVEAHGDVEQQACRRRRSRSRSSAGRAASRSSNIALSRNRSAWIGAARQSGVSAADAASVLLERELVLAAAPPARRRRGAAATTGTVSLHQARPRRFGCAAAGSRAPAQVHAREHARRRCAQCGGVRRQVVLAAAGRSTTAAGLPLSACRIAPLRVGAAARAPGCAWSAQVLHQVQVERQLLGASGARTASARSAPRVGVGEVVGVLDAAGDALERRQRADAEPRRSAAAASSNETSV
mgnify:CR=1 FL=1